jgi:hypothetical protein
MMDYEIDPQTHVVRSRLSGQISVVEMLESIDSLTSEPTLQPDFYAIVDATETDSWFSLDDVKKVATSLRQCVTRVSGRMAIAVYSHSLTILTTAEVCSTLLALASSRIQLKGFRDLKAAEEWIKSRRTEDPAEEGNVGT